MSNRSEAVIKAIAHGIPAALILLGFVAVIGENPLEGLFGDIGVKSIGNSLIAIGVIGYLIVTLITYLYRNSRNNQ